MRQTFNRTTNEFFVTLDCTTVISLKLSPLDTDWCSELNGNVFIP